jgi:hypothetical protein
MSPDLKGALLVFVAFVVVHVVLTLGTFDVVDLEEFEYGNVAVAMLDGQVDAAGYDQLRTDFALGDELLMTGAGRRRRAIWSIEPLVLPFFALFGASMLSLKLFAVTASALWAALWFLVARRLAPAIGPWWPALLLAVPLPLVQRSAISATSITAHLGSSVWHAAALLLVLHARERAGGRAVALLLASGLAAGLGLHCAFSLAPLLVGVVWLAWRFSGWRSLPVWAAGLLPGLALIWLFRDPWRSRASHGLITGLTGLSDGSVSREGGAGGVLETVVRTVVHGPGFGRVDGETLTVHYLPIAAVCSALLLGIVVVGVVMGRRASPPVDPGQASRRDLGISLIISGVAFYAVLLLSGFRLDPDLFDGLRYLLPICSLPTLAALWALSRLEPGRMRRGLAIALVACHVLGFALLFRPAAFPAPWSRFKGFEPWVTKSWLVGELEPERIREQRLDRWSLWTGIGAGRRAETSDWSSWSGWEERNRLVEQGRSEFWRGFGVGLLRRGDQGGDARFEAAGLPDEVRAWIWEGAALGYALDACDPEVRRRLIRDAPEDLSSSLWYGFGRADVYCRSYADAPGRRDPRFVDDFDRGFADGWRLDWWSGRGAPEADPEWVRSLRLR